MISTENNAFNHATAEHDFTVEHYRQLLKLAINQYKVATYSNIPWGDRFILWRHDIDNSINRSFILAKVENEEGMKATYFVNPHSEFYNIAENDQKNKIQEILLFGHDLGLHFDAAFYNITNENELDRLVAKEAEYLEYLVGVKPVAFSFHNPVEANLACEAEKYGALINCYSKRFKSEVPYCSDSNGYWRFRRLFDVLTEAKDPCLQVLTHPNWWQDVPMPPRQRIFRSVYGRAAATMQLYDTSLLQHNRLNHVGTSSALQVLKPSQPEQFEVCDYLWNRGQFQTLFVELWRIHESQINRFCEVQLRKNWQIPVREVNLFFGENGLSVEGWKLFDALFDQQWINATSVNEEEYMSWLNVRNQIIHGRFSTLIAKLEVGCVYLCNVIKNLSEWGEKQQMDYNGLTHIDSIGLPTYNTAKGLIVDDLDSIELKIPKHLQKRWEKLKKQFTNAKGGGYAI